MDVKIRRYSREYRLDWNKFVAESRNGTFLLDRDFMDYHSDRFEDMSFLFYYKERIIAVLPANIAGNILYTHQGLTYGGLIVSSEATTNLVLVIFSILKTYLQSVGIKCLFYKMIPYIYHRYPAEEDLYALFRNEARLISRSVSSCIVLSRKLTYSKLRKRSLVKALKGEFRIEENDDFASFWSILNTNLESRFGVSPVHSLEEILYLKLKFPSEIRLFQVYENDISLGGCVVFDTYQVAHVQYISASENGKSKGILDLLFDYLIKNIFCDKPYFEFGISTEDNGLFLNEGLISQKEGFGARAIVYDTYQMKIAK